MTEFLVQFRCYQGTWEDYQAYDHRRDAEKVAQYLRKNDNPARVTERPHWSTREEAAK